MPLVLLVIVFLIGILALQWFMKIAAVLLALAAIGAVVWWWVWIKNNRTP
jgi:hypothetical protein